MGRDVEEVAAALVREFLSRKGLKKTIACMDEELPRTSVSISNRSELCRVLHLESLYKKNKSEDQPLKSMLEIIVKERMRRNAEPKEKTFRAVRTTEQNSPKLGTDSAASDASCVRRDQELTDPHTDGLRLPDSRNSASQLSSTTPTVENHPLQSSRTTSIASSPENQNNVSISTAPSSQDVLVPSPKVELDLEKRSAEVDSQTSRGSSRMRRGFMSGLITASNQENSRRRPARRPAACFSMLAKNQDDSADMNRPSRRSCANSTPPQSDYRFTPPEQASRQSTTSSCSGGASKTEPRVNGSAGSPRADGDHMAVMDLDDVDDEDLHGYPAAPQINNSLHQINLNKHPMDQKTATDLKEIIFGSSMSCFSVEWKCQSFSFSDNPDLSYGIVQKKGGPCGVLAAVQATVLQKLLFEGTSGDTPSKRLHVPDAVRTKCLTEAVAEILWRTGDGKRATVSINSGRNQFSPTRHYRSEGVLEMITCIDVKSLEDLKQLVNQHIHQFESGPFGCVLLVVSAVLSRTVQMVRADMDVPTSTLMGAHGYCAQELVNLLLCGRAVSNVFNDEMKLDSGNGNVVLLKGIKERCNVGLLSLYEHYNICKVGSHLKQPRFPIWVVCSESHFSVLFSLSEDLTSRRWNPEPFDLYYYDGLANQQEPIRLTVYPDSPVKPPDSNDNSDLTPPLELCIRTRWADAAVSWNQSEPIL
ncbi:probable ubiquitin carboxyl-terminal hydrolase MINDY-4 isoform X2 [Trichomycterus rosablanca]|uniref:probable ubiquitin carboxyl-terminal hydrolase MINDY-4 isoform X2 n=1 Tax=Trichomycterus rosablanca TaxID=2290929 RepID=UPI002F34F112